MQFLKKRRVRHSRRIRTVNRRFTFGSQRGHGKGHGDTMISKRIQLRAVQMLAAWNAHAVGALFDFRPHLTQIGGDGGNAIRLFHAQFPGIVHLKAFLRIWRNRSQYRDLVNQSGRIGAGNYGAFPGCAMRLNRSDELAVIFFQMRDRNLQPHLRQNVEQPRPCRIHQNSGQGDLRSGKQCGRA
jgi:hypothetical protein